MAPGFGQGPCSSSSFLGPPSVTGRNVSHERTPELSTVTPPCFPSTPAITDGGRSSALWGTLHLILNALSKVLFPSSFF